MNKKISLLAVAGVTLLTITACGSQGQSKSDSKSSSTTTHATKKSDSKKMNNKKQADKQKTPTEQSMNLQQIQKGNYQSIAGDWQEVGRVENHHDGNGPTYVSGGQDQLTVTQNELRTTDITMQGTKLTDHNGTHDLGFIDANGQLQAQLKDEDSAPINWIITFYPKGNATDFNEDGSKTANQQDLISVWTSNNNVKTVYAKKSGNATKEQAKTDQQPKQEASSKFNLNQLMNNNFSSLVGKWQNQAGDSFTVTNQVEDKPDDSNVMYKKGAVVENHDTNGHKTVIGTGSMSNGYLMSGIGTFDTQTPGAFEPLAIVPKGQKAGDQDDSNVNKDRLIIGGGQTGYASQAYYRQ
ncbi:DUF6287 domain-containing protein [Fructilactobacillus hinvesii]|uniref:DUF6287 domain-containing protein n=1 Tax=Fructilactobacillus hinvesii TaxID=2940300 RepID=A0ABY5BSH2_9LACO|nr:DUF6287 domain-containing protein [Fructilactobacillus hinvesii]USS88057.1 DUF6287 domain-containing protein [Fructilactobacillus hinvesii]